MDGRVKAKLRDNILTWNRRGANSRGLVSSIGRRDLREIADVAVQVLNGGRCKISGNLRDQTCRLPIASDHREILLVLIVTNENCETSPFLELRK